jgi:putative hydrolase of the HAD superfamily
MAGFTVKLAESIWLFKINKVRFPKQCYNIVYSDIVNIRKGRIDMINTIIFDIGNVLIDFRWEAYLKDCGYDEEVARKVADATVMNKLWKEWDRGAKEADELIELCCRQEPGVEKEIRRLFDDFLLLVDEYDFSADFIKELKKNGYKVYLLSNYSKRNFELGKAYFKFYPYVDGGVISYEIQHIKPEPEIYEALIKRYDINPAEAVFLDDLPENLEGAKPFGFETIQVITHEQVLEDLRNLGVRI